MEYYFVISEPTKVRQVLEKKYSVCTVCMVCAVCSLQSAVCMVCVLRLPIKCITLKERVGLEEQRDSRHIVIMDYDKLKNNRAFSNDPLSLKTESNYSLRSSSRFLLLVPRVNCSTFGSRAFTHAAPALRNSLPLTIRSSSSISIFKKRLKSAK